MEVEHGFADTDDRFDGALARAIDGMADRRVQLAGHLDLWAGGSDLAARRSWETMWCGS